MKFRISLVVIFVSTALIIALINFLLSEKPKSSAPPVAIKSLEKKDIFEPEVEKEAKPLERPPLFSKDDIDDDDDDEDEDDEDDDEEDAVLSANTPEVPETNEESVKGLSPKDIETIKQIANLTDDGLIQEMAKLTAQISKENLIDKLEKGLLSKEEKIKAKQLIEQFALLGLEKTRRKYMDREPELKDPLVAHRQSLEEIRELLSDE